MSVVSEKLNRIESATNTIRTKVGASEVNTIEEVADMVKDIPIFYFDGDVNKEENKTMFDDIYNNYIKFKKPFLLAGTNPAKENSYLFDCHSFLNIGYILFSSIVILRTSTTEKKGLKVVPISYDFIQYKFHEKKIEYVASNNAYMLDVNSIDSIVGINNTTEWTPTKDYGLVHKKYVDDIVGNINNVLNTLVTVSEE